MTPQEIKKLRDRLGLSQEAFAQRINVSSVTVNRWENGRYHPCRLAQEKLQKLLRKVIPRKGIEVGAAWK